MSTDERLQAELRRAGYEDPIVLERDEAADVRAMLAEWRRKKARPFRVDPRFEPDHMIRCKECGHWVLAYGNMLAHGGNATSAGITRSGGWCGGWEYKLAEGEEL